MYSKDMLCPIMGSPGF